METSIPEALFRLLATSYVYQAKIQRAHWNITGPTFYQHHLLFDRIYNGVNGTIDRIAENLRSLDIKIPVSLSNFAAVSMVSEFDVELDPGMYVQLLLNDAQTIQRACTSIDVLINGLTDSAPMYEEDSYLSTVDYTGVCNLVGELAELYGTFIYLLRSSI
jgi:starvation-inducible DNA-binding protein